MKLSVSLSVASFGLDGGSARCIGTNKTTDRWKMVVSVYEVTAHVRDFMRTSSTSTAYITDRSPYLGALEETHEHVLWCVAACESLIQAINSTLPLGIAPGFCINHLP